MKKYLIIYLSIITSFNLNAQCFDPDSQIWNNTWESCSKSQNPITEYGETHWIMYDFTIVRKLSKTWVWNSNDPTRLNMGFRSVRIDYSENGEEWNNWGEMEFPKGTGEAIYSGFTGPDMSNLLARYVLITVINNHGGGDCAGIAEIKFNLLQNRGSVDHEEEEEEEDDEEECTEITETNLEELLPFEALITWFSEEFEDIEDFFINYKAVGDEEWVELVSFEAEVFLEELEPDTEYEYTISYFCADTYIISDVFTFTTPEEDKEDCSAIEDLFIIAEEFGVYIEWEVQEHQFFEIFLWSEDGEIEETEYFTNENHIFIDDLRPDTEYIFEIGAECNDEYYISKPFFFTTGEDLILIMEELSFKVADNKDFHDLKWVFKSDKIIKTFEIEYSNNGRTFESLGVIEAIQSNSNYSFQNKNIVPLNNYYRLKLNYQDGSSNKSKIIHVRGSGLDAYIQASPNPFQDYFNLFYASNLNETVNVYLYNLNGLLIFHDQFGATKGENNHEIRVDRLPAGSYIVKTVGLQSRSTQTAKVLCAK